MTDLRPVDGVDYPNRRLLDLLGDEWTPIVVRG